MIGIVLSLLLSPTPVWLSLCVIAACAVLAVELRALMRRVDRHARSIAHMDDWADSVDHALRRIEVRGRRPMPPPAASSQMSESRKWWQK